MVSGGFGGFGGFGGQGDGSGTNGSGTSNGVTIAGTLSGSAAANAGLTEGDTDHLGSGPDGLPRPATSSRPWSSTTPATKTSVSWVDQNGQSQTATVTLASGPAASKPGRVTLQPAPHASDPRPPPGSLVRRLSTRRGAGRAGNGERPVRDKNDMKAARGETVHAARLHAVGDLRVADEPEPGGESDKLLVGSPRSVLRL